MQAILEHQGIIEGDAIEEERHQWHSVRAGQLAIQVVVCTIIDPVYPEEEPFPECKLDSTTDAVEGIRVTPGFTLTDSFMFR